MINRLGGYTNSLYYGINLLKVNDNSSSNKYKIL